MKRSSVWFSAALFALCAFVSAAYAAHHRPAVHAPEAAKRVYVGIYLHDVTKLDQRDGLFDVELDLWVKWRGDFDPSRVEVGNATSELTREELSKEADGDWHSARWRLRGTLRGEFPLQRFPFDSQTLAVVLEMPAGNIELIPDLASSGIHPHFSITGWRYDPHFAVKKTQEVFRSDLGSLAGEGKPSTVNRVHFELSLHRPGLSVAIKLILPLLIIMLVALLALFIEPGKIDVRSSIGVTALLACFAFQFTVSGTLPEVAYLTIADGMFLVSYVVTTTSLLISIINNGLLRSERLPRARKIDRVARVLLPVVALLPIAIMARPPKAPSRATIEPLPKLAVEKSARNVVRIGTLTLSSIPGAPGGAGVFWGLVHKEPDDTSWAVFADTKAQVDTDTLRFLADGELEVAWRLRHGAKWSDGKPILASDVAFALEVSKDPDLVEVRVVSPRELVLRYQERIAAALDGPTPYPQHALQAAFKAGGYAAVREARGKQIVPSNGPYRVVEFELDKKMVLEANPHFLGPAPAIGRVEVTRFADSAAAIAAFERGEIDVFAPNTATPEDARKLRERRRDAVTLRPSSQFIFLAPDPTDVRLQKRDVRRALLLAIDRERIRREVFGDEGRVAVMPIPQSNELAAEKTPFDPDQARALLKAAGLADMELPITHGPGYIDAKISEMIVEDLQRVGVRARTNPIAKAADAYRERKWPGLINHVMRGSRETSSMAWWNLPLKDGQYLDETRTDAFDETIAELVDRERRALYPERRDQLRDRLFVEYTKRLPTLPIVFSADRLVADPKLRNWDHGPDSRFGAGIERWYFVASDDKK